MGKLKAQDYQGDQDPVAEDQPVARPGPDGALARMASTLVQRALVGGGPRAGQLSDQVGEVLPGQPGEDRMGEGRTSPCWRRNPCMIVRPVSCSPVDAHM
jgi:hypothetical protein